MLELISNPYDALLDFLAAGGAVLVAIMVTTFVMWALIIERLMYWGGAHSGVVKRAQRACRRGPTVNTGTPTRCANGRSTKPCRRPRGSTG